MRFESPYALLLLALLPFALHTEYRCALFAWFFRKRRVAGSAISFSSPIGLHSIPSSGRASSKAFVMSLIQVVAFSVLVVALARPQAGTEFTEVDASGRDIMLALDISRSMHAADFFLDGRRVDRLEALKKVVNDFIDARRGDRMGLVVFGDKAFTQCPLTLDHLVLKDFVNSLEIGMAGHATAIGSAIAIALKRMKEIESESKVIVLVTDGKSNAGEIKPKEASRIAKSMGVKIYTIGIGGDGDAPFPAQTIFGHTMYQNRRMEFDQETLEAIAEITDGRYFQARDTEALTQIYSEIDKIEERVETTYQHIQYEERFLPFLLVGFLLLAASQMLGSTVYHSVP